MNVPDSNLIYSLFEDSYKPQLIRAALSLDIFSPLADGEQAAEAVAHACGCNLKGIQLLLDYLTGAQNLNIFGRVHSALKPGGILVLDVPMGTGQMDENLTSLSLLLWAVFGGTAYSYAEYRGWLEEAGFHNIIQLSERRLKADR